VQLDAVTVARIELIEKLLVDARGRDVQAATFGQLLGRCIHHAAAKFPYFAPLPPMLAVAISMVRATLRALLMNSPRHTLLLAPSGFRAALGAVPLTALTTKTDDERRPAPPASPLDPVHSARTDARAENWSSAASHDHHWLPSDRGEGSEFGAPGLRFLRPSVSAL
jgi:hypothetical protein